MDAGNQIYKYIDQPLSPRILQKLLSVVENSSILKGTIIHSSNSEVFYEVALYWNILYMLALKDEYLTFEHAVLDVLGENRDSSAYKHYQILSATKAYADSKLTAMGMMPATDIVRINECICHLDTSFLDETIPATFYDAFSRPINLFMQRIFSSAHHPYILSSLLLLYSTMNSIDYALYPQTIEIVSNSLFQSKIDLPLPLSMVKYQLFHGYSGWLGLPVDDYLYDFLDYIEKELLGSCVLIEKLKSGSEKLTGRLKREMPSKHADDINQLLQKSICLRNETFVKAPKISSKTSIEYLKRLETNRLITGHKCGRKKIYINNHLLSIIWEAGSNGTKE